MGRGGRERAARALQRRGGAFVLWAVRSHAARGAAVRALARREGKAPRVRGYKRVLDHDRQLGSAGRGVLARADAKEGQAACT